jgi:chromosomal replication initiation ATPase DnaA
MTFTLSPEDIRRCRAINMRHKDRVKEIALAVSAETAIPLSAIYGKGRKREIVEARWIVMFLADRGGMSLQDIGRALNVDHTTVMNGLKRERQRRAEMSATCQ